MTNDFFEEDEPAEKILRTFEDGPGLTGWTHTYDGVTWHTSTLSEGNQTTGGATIRLDEGLNR